MRWLLLSIKSQAQEKEAIKAQMWGEEMTRTCTRALAIMIISTSSLVIAEDVWQDYRDKVAVAVKAYVEAYAKPGEQEKWSKNLAAKIEDTGRSLSTIALDWFFDHESDLNQKVEEKMIKACFFFMEFVKTNTPPSAQMRGRMTPQKFDDLISYLETKVSEKTSP